MKLDPPMLTEGGLSGKVYVVTHGTVEPHPTIPGRTMVIASRKYDVTEQFEALARSRTGGAMADSLARQAEDRERATAIAPPLPKEKA